LELLEAWATTRGWAFDRVGASTETGSAIEEGIRAGEPPMATWRAGVLLSGLHAGRITTVSDYSYDVYLSYGTGVATATRTVTAIVVEMPGRSLTVRIVPRWIGSRLWRAMLGRHPASNRQPRLRSPVSSHS